MKFTSDESIRALELALEREKEAWEFYKTCSETAQSAGTKGIVNVLAEEEKLHFEFVTDLLVKARSSGQAMGPDVDKTDDVKLIFEKAFGHGHIGEFAAESASMPEMLRVALDNERESVKLYSDAQEKAEELETASVYRYLAKEENKHFNMVSNIISFLGDPGNWLYEEENLIFRL